MIYEPVLPQLQVLYPGYVCCGQSWIVWYAKIGIFERDQTTGYQLSGYLYRKNQFKIIIGKNKNQYYWCWYLRSVRRVLSSDEWLWNGNLWASFKARWTLHKLETRRLHVWWMYPMVAGIKWKQSVLPVMVRTDWHAIIGIHKPRDKNGCRSEK